MINVATVLSVLIAGAAVGATSIGGVVVVPALTALSGFALREAIALSNFSFLFVGLAAVWLQRAKPASPPAQLSPSLQGFFLAAFLGALAGAFTLAWLPTTLIRAMVATIAILSGLRALRVVSPVAAEYLPRATSAWVGLAVGCVSAWSGTGGPVLLLPILMFAGMPLLSAVAIAQSVQLPIAGAAAAVNIAVGRLDLGLASVLGLLVLLGWLAGRYFAKRIAVQTLQRLVAIALVVVGIAYGWQALFTNV